MHAEGDTSLSARRPPWQRSPCRCDSTTATVLLAEGMVRPSRASKHIDAVLAKRTIKTILQASCAKQGERVTPPYDMHAKGDSPLSDRGPPWRRLPRHFDYTTATVLFADGKVRPSRASEHIEVVWAKRTINTMLEA